MVDPAEIPLPKSPIRGAAKAMENRFQPHRSLRHRTIGGSTLITLVIVALIALFGVFLVVNPGSTPGPDRQRNTADAAPQTAAEPPAQQPRPEPPTQQPPASASAPPAAATPPATTPPAATPPAQPQPRPVLPETSPLQLDRNLVDFGYVLIGQTRVEEVVLFNPSDVPLNVEAVHVSCPCTTTEVEPRRIAPGDAAVLRIEYTPQAYSHVAPPRSIRVQLREYPRQMHSLTVNAAIGREIRLNSDRAPFLSEMSGEVLIESHDQEPFRVLLVDGLPPNFVDFDPDSDEPRSSYVVRYNFEQSRPGRLVPRHLHVLTDRPGAPMADILTRFPTNFREDLNASPASWLSESRIIPLGSRSSAGEPQRVTMLLQRTRGESTPDLEVSVHPASGPSAIGPEHTRDSNGPGVVDAQIVEIEPGKTGRRGEYRVTVEFSVRPDAPAGLHNDILTFVMSDGSYTEVELVTQVVGSE